MVSEFRKIANQQFSPERYQAFLALIEQGCPGQLEFRISETPVFMSKELKHRLVAAGDYIVDFIAQPGFKALTEAAIPANCQVPNESDHPEFLAIDYAICADSEGNLTPRLIELQGFPSLFCFQEWFSRLIEDNLYVPPNYSYLFGNLQSADYIALLNRTILGSFQPHQVVLLEIEPKRQKTRIDFFCTEMLTGVKAVCVTEVYERDNMLFHLDSEGQEQRIHRIYNRVIFDELLARTDLNLRFDFAKSYLVEWAGHPAWFFRVSKYLLPFLDHPSVPVTRPITQLKPAAEDLKNYVLKPLFSFAGQGVVFDVQQKDIDAVPDPENWILQEKVFYAPAIKAPDADVKCEIRLLYLWPKGDPRPTLCTNLIRLSQGSMMGVRFNKDKTWVGGNTAFLERD